jgi:hypothetical protein
MTRHTITRAGTVTARGDGHTLDAVLVPWNVTATVSDDGRTMYTEEWTPGSLTPAPIVAAYAGHTVGPNGPQQGPLIGRVFPIGDGPDGYRATIELADTPTARDVYALASLVGADISIEADVEQPPDWRPGQKITRTAARPSVLTGVAIITLPNRGAYPGAMVTAARSNPTGANMDNDQTQNAGGAGTDTNTPPAPPAGNLPPPAPTDAPVTVARAEIDEMVRQAITRVRLPQLPEAAHPLARFRTLVECADAAYTDREISRSVARAWVDQVTGNNAGVITPGWLNEVFGIVDLSRPLIAAIGTRPLPDGGMDVDWPYFDGDLSQLVAEQVTQKTEIQSVRVDLKKGSAPIKTYAGGSDISYQLIRRSTPSYRDAYLRIMNAAYALRTDYAASAGLWAVADSPAAGWVDYDPAASDPDLKILRAAVFAASVQVEAATGQPASVVLAATDEYVRIGGALNPAAYPVQNVSGTSNASQLNVNLSGLNVAHARYLPAGSLVVTNGLAAKWSEDGPMVITAVDVPKLGEDTAIWGMGALEITNPAGLVTLAAVEPT